MILLEKDFLNNPGLAVHFLEDGQNYIYDNINIQKKFKDTILNYMHNFVISENTFNTNSDNFVYDFLGNLKESLNACNDNISSLESLMNRLNKVIDNTQNKDVNLYNIIKEYNKEHVKCIYNVNNTTLKISDCLCYLSKISNPKIALTTPNENIKKEIIESPQVEVKSEVDAEAKIKTETKIKSEPQSETELQSEKKPEYLENTLVISEYSNKVILPYTMSKLEDLYENNKDNYSSIDDVILKEYTLPLQIFKNPFIARFKEGYKLMRYKEKASISKSFDLGIELMFNYHVHPAIITACNNLTELDNYLDYIGNNEKSKFKYFKILFEIPPAVVKQNRG